MENNFDIKLECECAAEMGETPHWDEEHQCLRFVDVTGKKLLAYFPKTGELVKYNMPDIIGSANLAEGNKAVVALKSGLHIFNYETEQINCIHKRNEDEPQDVRYNDSKCDIKGRLFAGTTSMERHPYAALYCVTDKMKEIKSGITIANGMAFTMDNKTFYHIDTWVRKIYECDYDVETGEVSEGKIAFEFPEDLRFPDGMTIDTEDMLWVCFWGGGCISRFNPKTGEELLRIKTPVMVPTCPTFGGDDYKTLYFTTAVADDKSPLAGSVFSIKLPYQGVKHNRFKYGEI